MLIYHCKLEKLPSNRLLQLFATFLLCYVIVHLATLLPTARCLYRSFSSQAIVDSQRLLSKRHICGKNAIFSNTSLPLTSTKWVRSTVKLCTVYYQSCWLINLGNIDFFFGKIWERRESKPGPLGDNRECSPHPPEDTISHIKNLICEV